MPALDDENRDPLEVLAADFIQRQRSGEHPAISEYAARHPELATEIEELFPTIVAMEQLKAHREGSASGQASLGAVRLERLGDFRILGEIGRGGMGIVYEAFQESLGRHVAVKVLPRQSLLDPKQLQRFQREAQTAARLHHTNIVPLFGVGEQEGYHYIVMQLIRGVSLDDVLAKLRQLRSADAAKGSGASLECGDLSPLSLDRGDVCRQEKAATSRRTPKEAASADMEKDPRPLSSGNGSSSEAVRLARVLAEGKFWQERGDTAPAPLECGDLSPLSLGQTNVCREKRKRRQVAALQRPGRRTPNHGRFGPAYWRSVAAIGVQTAEALHYAHAHHTLHRDVKPANLLLDSQGVVWITDFGLAKALDQDNPSQTAALAGTLRYMAPEQFSGRLDARSDVYSLGLTLYELVTLQPAFADVSRSKLIRKITQGQPVRPRQVNPAIPRDLETIILKSVAHEPAHRYPSAAEMADDLQRFLEDRPIAARRVSAVERLWRWSRRNRALAALTASTFVLLVLFAVVATAGYVSTARERQRFEATSVLALDALDNIFRQFAPERTAPASGVLIVGDTGEEITVPAQPVLSKQAAALLEHMLAFYDRLAEQGGDDARLRRKVAEANRRVGDIRQRLGHFEESKAAYLRAIDWYTQLAEASEDGAELRTEIARVHNEIGNLHLAMNEHEAARASYSSALATLQGAAAELSASPQHQYELARTYYFLGKRSFGQIGPFPLARFGRRFPRFGLPGKGFAMAGSPRRSRGSGMGEPGPPPGPPPEPRGQSKGRSQDRPGRAQTSEVLETSEVLGTRSKAGPEPPPGPPKDEAGVTPRPPNTPSGPSSRSRRPFPFGTPEDMEKFRQREKEREENLQKAIELLERLVAEHPAAPDYRHLLARCYREVRPSWRGRGSKLASDGVDKAAGILQKLVEEHPDVPDYRYDLSLTYAWLSAWPFSSDADNSTAEQRRGQMLEKAVAISDELVAEHPNIPDYAVFHVHIRLRLADTLWESGPTRAENSLRKALDLQTTLARRFPQNSFYKLGLGFIQESLAVFLRDRDELPEARTLTDDCIASLKAALEKDPKLWHARGLLAQNYWNLADLLARLDDEQAAAEAARQAQELFPVRPETPAGPPGR